MKKVNVKMLALFFENMSFLIGAGTDALTSVATLASNADTHTAAITRRLSKELAEGKDLSEAFEKHKSFFRDSSYSIYIAAGLKSGELANVLLQLSQDLNATAGIKKQIVGAMTYPAVLMVITIIVSIYMFTSLVPQIAANVQEVSGGEMPRITQVAMNISNFLINEQLQILMWLAITAIVAKILFTVFRTQLSKVATKIPIVGKLIMQMDMGNFYRNLAHMLSANIPISECLAICSSGAKNRFIKQRLVLDTKNYNEQGYAMGKFISDLPFTSPSERQCVLVAENTGRLAEMFSTLADRQQKDLQQTIKTLLTMVEPLMLLVMGGIIGSIVFAVYMPILSMTTF